MGLGAVAVAGLAGVLLAAARAPERAPEQMEADGAAFADIQAAARRFYDLGSEQPRSGWKQYRRWEWLARTRLDRHGRFNPALSWKRWEEGRTRAPSGRVRPDLAEWTFMGPSTLPLEANPWGLRGMGRLNCIAFHPADPETLWVGAPSGGLWRTTDGGQTWATSTDLLPNIGVSDILIHPDDPDTMVLALGDGDAGTTLSVGVLTSTDGGQSWRRSGLDPSVSDGWRISKLVFEPDDPDVILAATSRGIYRSTDAGATWQRTVSGYFKDIEVHPSDPSRCYASRYGVGVYRSSDAGASWERLETGLPTEGLSRVSLAIAPSRPQTVYAAYARDGTTIFDGFGFLGLYRSTDGGDTWSLRSSSPNVFGNRTWETSGLSYSLGSYAQVLEVSPTDPDALLAGSVNLWRSADGGLSWHYVTNQRGEEGAAEVHSDHHELVTSPFDSQVVFSCHDGGLHRSDDWGTTWVDLSDGLAIRQIYRLGTSAHHPSHVIIGAQDNGTDYFDGEWLAVYTGDGMSCFVDPRTPETIYFSYQNARLFRSDNAGLTWSNISGGFERSGAWVTPFLMDPVDPSTLYVAITGVHRSTDRGEHWSPVGPELSDRDLTVLAVAPSSPQRMMASDSWRLFRTEDGGAHWTEVTNLQLEDLVTDLAFHPRDPDRVWLSLGGYGEWNDFLTSGYAFGPQKVLHSSDAGRTWADVTGHLPEVPVNCIAIQPSASAVFIGTDLGVLWSEDGGSDWQVFARGLPNVIVTDLEIDDGAGTIWAATYGRGAWRSPLVSGPYDPELYPPLFLSGRVERTGPPELSTRHVLTWAANPRNADGVLSGYRLYRVGAPQRTVLAELDAATFTYVSAADVAHRVAYELTAVGAGGEESLPLALTLRY